MIGIVLVTHGHLATEFRAALEHVVRAAEADWRLDHHRARRRHGEPAQGYHRRDRGGRTAAHGVVVLTDMFGGTPSNLGDFGDGRRAMSKWWPGVNLPMLIKLASVRDDSLA